MMVIASRLTLVSKSPFLCTFVLAYFKIMLILNLSSIGYPNCKISEPWKIGNGVCDQEYNEKYCLYDGNDCCPLNANDFSEKDLYGGKQSLMHMVREIAILFSPVS